MIEQWLDSNNWATLKGKTNQAIDLINSMTNAIVPVGAILPYYGNINDASLFDVGGVGLINTTMEKFALCVGQGLAGSLLKNFDGTPRSITPDLRDRFLIGQAPGLAVGVTGGESTHKHVWQQRSGATNQTWDILGQLKNWLFSGLGNYPAGAVPTAAVALDYNTQFSDSKSYTDISSNMPPYMVVAYIIRYK